MSTPSSEILTRVRGFLQENFLYMRPDLELGADEAALHAAIAKHPGIEGVKTIHCVGPRMRALWEALPRGQRGDWAETAADLAARARALVDAGDIILVKGSKGSKVSLVVDGLRKLGQAVAPKNEGTM